MKERESEWNKKLLNGVGQNRRLNYSLENVAMICDSFTLGGYYPGSIGQIVEAHALYYSENWGFDVSFESQVAMELGGFMSRFNPKIHGFWTAQDQKLFAGSIAIDGENSITEGARLRWFIVGPHCRDKGIGKRLLNISVKFCADVGHSKVFLWTFRGLDAARNLYERVGFELVEEKEVAQWGTMIVEQKFELEIGNMNTDNLVRPER